MNEDRNKMLALIRKSLRGYPEVRAAYLFGSRAEGYERKTSDIDIAVFIDEKLDKMKAFSLQLELGEALERKLRERVDLVVLNRAPLPLAFRAVKGLLILERDPTERALFEARILSRYYDYRHFERLHLRALYYRAKEGKFAKP